MVYKSVVHQWFTINVVFNRNERLQNVVDSVKTNYIENYSYVAFENSVMFQMFQYFIKGIVSKKLYMNPGNDNDNEINLLIDLFTEIMLWYTIYVIHLCFSIE